MYISLDIDILDLALSALCVY